MGVNGRDLSLLIRLKEAGYIPAGGAVVEIGAQQLDNGFLRAQADIARMGELFGARDPLELDGHVPAPAFGTAGTEPLSPAAPFARGFWQWLGLDYASIDVDGSPGSIPLDLNEDEVPEGSRGKYHLVTNFGTTEHIANQLNAFRVIHDLAVPDGVIIHSLPAQGAFSHGLFDYTPKFFWRLAQSNEYRWIYFDYREDGSGFLEVPQNLVDQVELYEPNIVSRKEGYRLVEASMVVVLQKRFDSPFVPPVDVPDSAALDRGFVERYRSVLNPGWADSRTISAVVRNRVPMLRRFVRAWRLAKSRRRIGRASS